MYFTLAISAATPTLCAGLADRARIADPAVLPVPGPAVIAWRSPDGRAALLHWGLTSPGRDDRDQLADPGDGLPAVAHAGTIWTGTPTPGSGRAPVYARTSVTRVEPVYVAEVPGGVIVADRALWAAWTANRLDAYDPLHLCALLNPGFPLGGVTPFTGVSALTPSTTLHLLNGVLTRIPTPVGSSGRSTGSRPGIELRAPSAAPSSAAAPSSGTVHVGQSGLGLTSAGPDREDARPGPAADLAPGYGPGLGGARAVAEALVAAVADLQQAGAPVMLSLTGGKDSRLVAAALVAAGVPVVARTHGFASHPDVMVAAKIARRLGIEHIVKTPAAPGQQVEVLGRIRATVLVADGMLSAFENVGRPDPSFSAVITAGGHGGELLRGGYAETAGRPGRADGLRRVVGQAHSAARAAELLRRLTTRHLGLVRRGPAAGYVASLAPWTAALARGPLAALDDFYLVNRAGRWSAAARQAYLIRETLIQPLFDEQVVAAARAVPLADRISGALTSAVLAELCPALTDIPLAGKAQAGAAPASFDWRRQYGDTIGAFLRGYTLDLGTVSSLFDVVSRPAAEKLLASPQADRATVWALATLACLVSGDYRRAREPSPALNVA